MNDKYKELSGCEPSDASDISIRLKVLAGELSKLYQQLEVFENQLFPQTSSGDFLDLHAELRGLSRKPKVAAVGVLKFSRQSKAITDLPIPVNTIVASSTQENPMYFKTTKNAVLKAGKTAVEVEAVAVDSGIEGNLALGLANILVSNPIGITAVMNTTPFSGGREREADNSLKERTLYSYANGSNSVNAAYYYTVASAHKGVAFAKVIPKKRGIGTVDVVICATNPLDQPTIINEIKAELSQSREICVDVFVQGAVEDPTNIKVELQTKDAFNFDEVALNCQTLVSNWVNRLDIGEPLRLAHLSSKLIAVDGVLNCKFITPSGDLSSLNNHVIRSGNITVAPWGG